MRVACLVAALARLGADAGPPEKATLGRAVAAPPTESQIAAGEDRLKAAAARLRTATLALDAQPAAAGPRANMKSAIQELEASYEYLVGMFQSLNEKDNRAMLKLLQDQLNELRKQKQALLDKMAASTKANEWRSSLPGFVALSDHAFAAVPVRRSRVLSPTPVR